MAEKFRFFDAVQDENGVYDREYNAQEFTDYFKALVTTGIMKGAGNELSVSANGSNMITSVNTGIAFLLGRYYENDSALTLTHDTETLGNSRIDRIVIRMDLATEARYVRAFIKKGVASANPVAPTLTQTQNLYEISLAQVRVVGGQTFITANNVTDERGKDIICPWAGSNILPNFNETALQELVSKVNNMYQVTNGPNTKTFTGDLNNLKESGFYIAVGASNKPPELSFAYSLVVEVISSVSGSEKFVSQKVYLPTRTSVQRQFIRYGYEYTGLGFSWGEWEIAPRGRQAEWIKPTLTNGTHDTLNFLKYYKDDFGVVHVDGEVRPTSGMIVWQMPVGYYPERNLQVPMVAGAKLTTTLFNAQGNGYFIGSSLIDNFHHFHFSYRAKV